MVDDHQNRYQLVSALFLRLLGACYLVAFLSIAVQIDGLVGSQGILPFQEQLDYLNANAGIERFFQVPTVFWLSAADWALLTVPVIGALFSILVIINRLVRPALIVAFILYLSLYHASQLFMNFQWDALLLEAGFLGIFLTPNSRVIIWLFRWLLFRLRFMSGLSKLTVQDPSWSGLTALNFYFEVQPLPSPFAWYAHQLPEWLLRLGTASTLVIELLVPFMMFLPRRWRFIAAWITILWQVLIIVTSNHNWFNFLTIFLCLFLFDDKALKRVLPNRIVGLLQSPAPLMTPGFQSKQAVTGLFALVILISSTVHFWELATMKRSTGFVRRIVDYTEAYRIVTKYHVFPTMKTQRIELEILGSQDGLQWKLYRFKYRPGDPGIQPAFIVPHQPRLDWMMWFVTLHPKFMPWFERFVQSLLNNSHSVTKLLEHNPFPHSPPNYIRIEAFRYTFSNPGVKQNSGHWWQRQYLGPFTPMPWVTRQSFLQPQIILDPAVDRSCC